MHPPMSCWAACPAVPGRDERGPHQEDQHTWLHQLYPHSDKQIFELHAAHSQYIRRQYAACIKSDLNILVSKPEQLTHPFRLRR
nr:hypothetical protein CFP56_79635 [Quercus suber]